MEQLSYNALNQQGFSGFLLEDAPEKILQFGEGNFLRAFVDLFVDVLNEKCGFNAKVCVVQPISEGLCDIVNKQQGLYTLYLRGYEQGTVINQKRVISCISRGINPYLDFEQFIDCAKNPSLRYIVSNTTEAGIVFNEACRFNDKPPSAFPAKLTLLLYKRFCEKLPGFVMLPCELIDNNGQMLKSAVVNYIKLWGLSVEFEEWVNTDNIFCSTLVDRIATGYPKVEADKLNTENNYEDELLDTAETFGFWAIEGPDELTNELPFKQAGLPVIITPSCTSYKQRKVRILNGAHTALVPAAHLCGKKIVRECMDDFVLSTFMQKAVFDEIIPTLDLPLQELQGFAFSVTERFKNPFIDHSLLAIALNSTSKWRARVMPSLKKYYECNKIIPRKLAISLAALIVFYKEEAGKNARDEDWIIEFYASRKTAQVQELVLDVLSCTKMWGESLNNIPNLSQTICNIIVQINQHGIYEVLKDEQSN